MGWPPHLSWCAFGSLTTVDAAAIVALRAVCPAGAFSCGCACGIAAGAGATKSNPTPNHQQKRTNQTTAHEHSI